MCIKKNKCAELGTAQNMVLARQQAEIRSELEMAIKPHNMGVFKIVQQSGSRILTSDVILESKMAISGKLTDTGSQLEIAVKPHNMSIFGIGWKSGSKILTFDNILESQANNRK